MARQLRQRITREANAFRIWREGSSVDWDCTVGELAQATGLHYNTVRVICQERGWTPRGFHDPARLDSYSVMLNRPARSIPSRCWRGYP